ncbi:hypothetical protein [Massilia sp. TWR1-2-2]|uniref:hypothetical protein n=1 Tax=Massilia sp. TWR1-2-2 TaxID=2804584 RepID=UPI003CF41278
MATLFVVGLPKELSARLIAIASANAVRLTSILAEVNDAGKLQLVPFEVDAIYAVQGYINSLAAYEEGNVLVLPYASLSDSVSDELATLADVGGTLTFAQTKDDIWPRFNGSPDQPFLEKLFSAFVAKFFPLRPQTPSQYFGSVAERTPRLLIAQGALDLADKVAPQRKKFIMNCADAFAALVSANGKVGTLEDYFAGRSLIHAQSGGVSASLCLMRDETSVYQETRNTHLKQGDKTTPQGSPRVYFHSLFVGKDNYVGVIYAGPHPSSDFSKTHVLK